MNIRFVVETEADEKETKRKENINGSVEISDEKIVIDSDTDQLDSLTCPLCYNFPKKSAKHLPCCNRVICSDCLRDFFQSNESQILPNQTEVERLLRKYNQKQTQSSEKPEDNEKKIYPPRPAPAEEENVGPTCPYCRAQFLFYPGLIKLQTPSSPPESRTITPATLSPPENQNQNQTTITVSPLPQFQQQLSDDDIPLNVLSRNLGSRQNRRVLINFPDADIQCVLVGLDVFCPFSEKGCSWKGRRDS
ncbi:hypothetical protein HK096_008752, partial [Nowakowskiella sp. JEL0078]